MDPSDPRTPEDHAAPSEGEGSVPGVEPPLPPAPADSPADPFAPGGWRRQPPPLDEPEVAPTRSEAPPYFPPPPPTVTPFQPTDDAVTTSGTVSRLPRAEPPAVEDSSADGDDQSVVAPPVPFPATRRPTPATYRARRSTYGDAGSGARPLAPTPSHPAGAYRLRPSAALPPPPPPETAAPRRYGMGRTLLVGAAAGIVGALVVVGAAALLDDGNDAAPVAAPPVTVIERVTTEIVNAADDPVPVAPAVGRTVIPSVVTVEVDSIGGDSFDPDGSGSGVVLTTDGYIATNEHVVADSELVQVIFADGRVYEAAVIGTDAFTDLAVLDIEATGLLPIEQGSTTELEIGDAAIAVGNPLGLQGGPSLTVGVISAFERQVQTGPNSQTDVLFGMLQTDAPITSGSSGGALVDEQGRLIGITSAIGVSNVGAEGIGFAIPIELVQRVTDEIITTGEAKHPFLGIAGVTEFDDAGDGAQIPVGVLIQSVEGGSAAGDAGLEVGDRITEVADDNVTTMDGLIVSLREYPVGTPVEVTVLRGGEQMVLTVTLGERPAP